MISVQKWGLFLDPKVLMPKWLKMQQKAATAAFLFLFRKTFQKISPKITNTGTYLAKPKIGLKSRFSLGILVLKSQLSRIPRILEISEANKMGQNAPFYRYLPDSFLGQ